MASAVICWDEVTELTSAELDLNVMHVRGSEKKDLSSDNQGNKALQDQHEVRW